jgi:hypothetical protein
MGTGALVLMLIVIVLVFVLRRKFILAPLLFGMLLLPFGQTFVIGGMHLFVGRILILAGLLRGVSSNSAGQPLLGGGFNIVDKFFALQFILRACAFVLRLPEFGAVANQIGLAWDTLGGYFLMRMLIQKEEDILRATKILSVIAAVLGATMLAEKFLGVNVYGFLKNVPIISEVRKGSIRAQGPFHHAILAGVFGATLLPLFFWLWKSRKARFLGLTGMIASTIITFTAASSTPASAYLAAVFAICMWPLRTTLRLIRWGIVFGILVLNFAMTAPVWWALEHIDLAGGSSGGHRAELIDNFVRHFGDWWLIGTSDNAKWGYEMWDQSNTYVNEGEQGGLMTFVCFTIVLYLAYKWVGVSRQSCKGHRSDEWFFWLLGATLFAHSVAFFGISYFDQTKFSWYLFLAMISAGTAPLIRARTPHQAELGEPAPEIIGEPTLDSWWQSDVLS